MYKNMHTCLCMHMHAKACMHVFIHALITLNATPLHAITQSVENDTPEGSTVT